MNDGPRLAMGTILFVILFVAGLCILYMTELPIWVFWVMLIAAIAAMLFPFLFMRGPQAVLGGSSFSFRAPFVNLEIPYREIKGIELRDSFKPGLRTFGFGTFKRGSGRFSNKEFGGYTLSVNTDIPAFVVVRYDSDRTFVFNLRDAEETRRIFECLRSSSGSGSVTPVSSKAGPRTKIYAVAAIGMISAVLVAVICITCFAGHVNASMDEDSLHIDAFMVNEDILYTDIVSVELRDNMDYGDRRAGYGGMGYLSGRFSNSEFGNYELAVHKGTSDAIVVTYGSGSHLVFNLSDNAQTQTFYSDLSARV